MKKTYLGIGILVILLLVVGFLWMKKTPSVQIWCTKKQCFSMEIADTPQKRSVGLMFRTQIKKDHGMVFLFPSAAKHPFRMKNTLIPLDMIRVDTSYTIVDIQEAKPCKQDPCPIYSPSTNASYVIELPGGTAKTVGMLTGDQFMRKK